MRKISRGRKPKNPCACCGKKSTGTYMNVHMKKKVAFAIKFCDDCGDIAVKQSTDRQKIYKI